MVAANCLVKSPKFTQVRQEWGEPRPDGGLGKTGPLVLKKLSDFNLKTLRDELQCNPVASVSGSSSPSLTGQERAFVDAVLNAPWFITHATRFDLITDEAQTLRLMSNHHLKSIERAKGHSDMPEHLTDSEDDIAQLGNDHYVYFSLEAGEEPKKPSSRFGQTMYRMALDRNQLGEHSVMMLNDAINPSAKNSLVMNYQHIPYEDVFEPGFMHHEHWKTPSLPQQLSESVSDSDSSISEDHVHEVPDRYFFQASQSLEALALAVVASVRKFDSEQLRTDLLRTDSDSINKAVNSLFRPQIMVPYEFVRTEPAEVEVLLKP